MGMRFFGGGVGHKSTRAATDQFLWDRDHSDLQVDIETQHDTIDNLMDCEDEGDDSPVAEGQVLDNDEDYGYGDPLDEHELEGVGSDDSDNDDSGERDGALVGGS
jgi:hypothetical protein